MSTSSELTLVAPPAPYAERRRRGRGPRTDALDVALVTMPWGRSAMPSIQCGLLKASLVRAGHRVQVLHPNLQLSKVLGPVVYDVFAEMSGDRAALLGEWVFTAAFFPPEQLAPDEEYEQLLSAEMWDLLHTHGLYAQDLRRLRHEVLPRWVDEVAASPDWAEVDVVGFSSTFEQQVPSLALAQALKRRHPKLVTVFGGANFDGEMGAEYARVFRTIDLAVSGEADRVLPALVDALAEGGDPLRLPGVSGWRGAEFVSNGQAPPVPDIDVLPPPDFDDYFDALGELGQRAVLGGKPVSIVYQSSRGCWWGEKHHCTFCGLNALGMTFRAKQPGTFVSELTGLVERHGVHRVQTVDNILDMTYIDTACRELAEQELELDLFYEVKANLTRDQVARLRSAGVSWLQPGIESLSSHVLGLMRKGSTLLTNVGMLKWGSLFGIDLVWNILSGFPGETDEDYADQARLVPGLVHLQPPGGVGRIWLERFSPYFTEDHPIFDVAPVPAYSAIYAGSGLDVRRIAYYFDYRSEGVAAAAAVGQLDAAVRAWQQAWRGSRRPSLTWYPSAPTSGLPDGLVVIDRRGDRPRRFTLDGRCAAVHRACEDRARTAPAVARELSMALGEVQQVLDRFEGDALVLRDGDRYLSLALPGAATDVRGAPDDDGGRS